MRHSFKFPFKIRNALKNHIRNAIDSVEPSRFRQEPDYVAALAVKMQGVIYDGNDGFVEIRSTIADSYGKGSAERWTGIDLAITAYVSDKEKTVSKAIVFQAKIGGISHLKSDEKLRLHKQIMKMKRLTRSPKVMEIVRHGNKREPYILSGNKIAHGKKPMRYSLENYFVQRILTTLDGDTRPDFVSNVQDSRMTKLKIIAKYLHDQH